ncbi:hypothetical protein D3C72_1591480 [compost metagenome]
MHPAGGQQLAHGGIDYRDAGAALLPGFQFVGGVAPGQALGFLAEGAMAGDPRIADQYVLVELAPEQLVDPAHGAGVAAVELPQVALQGGVQALAGREHAGGEVRREPTGAGLGGEVAALFVAPEFFQGEGGQPLACCLLTRRPELAQAVRRCGKAVHRGGRHVAGDPGLGLGMRGGKTSRQGAVQALVAELAELAIDLEVTA